MKGRDLSILTAVAYVGSVYIFPGGRSNRRDDMPVMLRRIAGVLLLTIFAVRNFGTEYQQWAGRMDVGVLKNVIRSFLMLHFIYLPSVLAFGFPRLRLKKRRDKVQAVRDLLVGPITEELVYRGVIASIYVQDGLTGSDILRENFLYFGVAHIHHAVMTWLDEQMSLKQALLSGLLQFAMTGLFGTYACYWLLKTGTVWPSVIAHIVCNYYGPPRLTGPWWYTPLLISGFAIWAYNIQFI